MAKMFMKKKSKRVTTRMRCKVEKKVRQHNKKLRRAQKKNPQKRKKKDPGIPNNLPFKEEVLREAETRRKRAEEEQERLKQKRKNEREKLLAKKRNMSRNGNLEGLVKDADKKRSLFEKKQALKKESSKRFTGGKSVEISLKTYYKEFKKVVDAADVVLEILDARDPLGSRCTQMEDAVLNSGTNKRLVLVLNKIDLVPRENVEAWLTHLRNELPAVAFKASTQTQNDRLCQTNMPMSVMSDDLLKSSHCLGADVLMKLLGNYCRNKDIQTNIRVGVVGFPNTGKSSIINSLKRMKACCVGATPGVTKSMQEVHLDKHIRLLDSPGIVMTQETSDTSVILRNCVKLENLDDLVEPVDAILKRVNKQQMMLHYNIPDFKDVGEFLSLMAKRLGRLKKGGIPDVNKAARSVLQDWNSGKISYYTHPPEQHLLPTHISAEFVGRMGEEFSIQDISIAEGSVLQSLAPKSCKHMLVASMGPAKVVMDESEIQEEEAGEEEEAEMEEEEEEDERMEEEEDVVEEEEEDSELKNVSVSVGSSGARTRSSSHSSSVSTKVTKVTAPSGEKSSVSQLNKNKKKEFKKMKKNRKRADKVAGALSDALTSAFSMKDTDDDYNFNTDFV